MWDGGFLPFSLFLSFVLSFFLFAVLCAAVLAKIPDPSSAPLKLIWLRQHFNWRNIIELSIDETFNYCNCHLRRYHL